MRVAAVVACCLAFAAPAAATDRIGSESVNLVIDHARVLRLPDQTQTVIVGNPIIADVSAQRNGIVVLTGKSYGRTNFIALDASGSILTETTISVQAPSEAMVTVQRGFDRESYSCTPDCQPSLLLGDATKYFSDVGGQAGQRNQLATSR
jgi:Flp pilus assembly secretin CpaC